MQTMHLFAGAGGGLLADLILGHDPVVAVEWDAYCCQVLRERAAEGWFPNLSVWEGDVRLFDPSEYKGRISCIHAGFPCQDVSVSGNQAGVGPETRSGLYREVLRIAGVVRPRYLFLENVAAIVNNGLGTVLSDLMSFGYDAEWLCLRASDCGAKHHRDRWWLLAHANRTQREGGGISCGVQQEVANSGSGGFYGFPKETMADSKCVGLSGQGEPIGALDTEETKDRETTESEHGGFGNFWGIEPDVGRVANGVASRVDRLKAIGNGQVPLQAALAWKLLGGP